MSNINESDYDKKYKEDLEKAQELSLESLALEKFRQEKQKHKTQITHSFQTKPGNLALFHCSKGCYLFEYFNQLKLFKVLLE